MPSAPASQFLAAWTTLVYPPPSSRPSYGSSKREINYRDSQALLPPLNDILEDLFAIEKTQHDAGDDSAAQDTLLLAPKSVEIYPRKNYMPGERPQHPNVWLASIAGRMQLRQRNEPADILLAGRDWASDSRRLRGFDDAIVADTAAGAEDVATLSRLSDDFNSRKHADQSDQYNAYRIAVRVDTHLAILAGRRGDADTFRQKAQSISGHVAGIRESLARMHSCLSLSRRYSSAISKRRRVSSAKVAAQSDVANKRRLLWPSN